MRDGVLVIPWVLVDTATIPGGEGELKLMRRGAEFSIQLAGNELMTTRLSGSEEALASETCKRLVGRPAPHCLIGGLGLGFTLRAGLAALGPDACVTVAELVPAVAAWARGPLAHVFDGCLDDPRVSVFEGDVGALIHVPGRRYDAILLDVDNGPAGLTRKSNDALYGARGLAAARSALRPGGLLSVWSVDRDPAFAARMRQVGFLVEELRVRGNAGKRGARHVIWIGRLD